MRNGFLAFVAGAAMGLASFSAVSQDVCKDGSEPRMSIGGSSIYSYAGAARHLGQPVLEAAGFTGQGTAVAHIENKTLAWFFRPDDGRPPPFGACVQPKNVPPDHWGWAPESDPAFPNRPCRVAWVMCIEADADSGAPRVEGADNSAKGLRSCLRGTDGMWLENKKIFSKSIGGHGTSGGMGIVTMAPDTKIVAIALNGVDSLDARAAFRWLYTKGDDYVLKRKNLNADQVYLKAGTKDERRAWRKYWRDTFGNQSPAEKFNIVSAALTWRINVGGFSEICEATNPDIPQGDQDGDGAIDIADNCVFTPNRVRTNVGTKEQPFWLTEYPDGDEDGRGNMCDGDFNNDGVSDSVDVAIFARIENSYDSFEPPLDINNDGRIDELDKAMFFNAADFNWDGVVDAIDRNYFAKNLWDKPPGVSNVDVLPFYEGKRNPHKYLQDKSYKRGDSIARISAARFSSFDNEFARMRKAGVLPVITGGSDGFTNGLLWPACAADALAVAGVQHTSDIEYYANYDRLNNTYVANPILSVRVNASPTMPVLGTHGPGRVWQPLGPHPQNEEVLGCDINPLNNGGYAGSFTPAVVAGAVAALKSPGLLKNASPDRIEKLLMQTSERAYVRRDCTKVLSPNRDPYDPAESDIYCLEHLHPEAGDNFANYSIPLMNLSDTYSIVKRLRASKTSLLKDKDKDGFDDSADNCRKVKNKLQRDSDGDGYGNACDADYNNDGRTDQLDSNYFVANYLDTNNPNGDFNGDGRSDSKDYNYLLSDLLNKRPGPSGLDKDWDGIVDHLDNCRLVSNGPWTYYNGRRVPERNQADMDGDFFGDLCDGDLNEDTVVDDIDRRAIESVVRDKRYYYRADFNQDQVVDQNDLDYFNANYDTSVPKPPGPSGLCRFWLKVSDAACAYYD